MRVLTVIIRGILILAIAILWLRFAVQLLGVMIAPVTGWIMEASDIVLWPFKGLFPSFPIAGQSVLEFTTLFAIVVYEFIKFAIARAFRFIYG